MATRIAIPTPRRRGGITFVTSEAHVVTIGRVLNLFEERGLRREHVEAAVDLLISCFDAIDGDSGREQDDCDIEPDDPGDLTYPEGYADGSAVLPAGFACQCYDVEEDDPSGDPLDAGELDYAKDLLPPVYGIDQSLGPINEREFYRAHQLALLETGR